MIRVLCDVHIPYRLVSWLREKGVDARHVNDLPDKSHTRDSDICRFADLGDYVVISKDADFRNSHFVRQTPKKLLRIALGNIPNNELLNLFDRHLAVIEGYFGAQAGHLELSRSQLTRIP